MESYALTGLIPPIAYSFNGKPGPRQLSQSRCAALTAQGARWGLRG
jgi:hypothetical protein